MRHAEEGRKSSGPILRYNGHEYTNPIGPQGRVILAIAADKVNTPRRMGRR
jgi:hypothetical protein